MKREFFDCVQDALCSLVAMDDKLSDSGINDYPLLLFDVKRQAFCVLHPHYQVPSGCREIPYRFYEEFLEIDRIVFNRYVFAIIGFLYYQEWIR